MSNAIALDVAQPLEVKSRRALLGLITPPKEHEAGRGARYLSALEGAFLLVSSGH